jgi:Potential Queuosine, Q, salvage protein family
VERVAASLTQQQLSGIASPAAFDGDLHFRNGGPLTVQYLLALDAINFCFWPDPELEYEHLALGLKVRKKKVRRIGVLANLISGKR